MNRELFRTRLIMLRKKLGLSQAEFAKACGISRPTVGFYENGGRVPDIEVLFKICASFTVPPGYFLGLDDKGREEYIPDVHNENAKYKILAEERNLRRMFLR